MSDCSTTRLPGLASATSADVTPPSGRFGRPVSGSTGIAIVLPGLVRDVSSNDTYRNLPSGDQAHGHDLPRAQIGRGDPPVVGTAIVTAVPPTVEPVAVVETAVKLPKSGLGRRLFPVMGACEIP